MGDVRKTPKELWLEECQRASTRKYYSRDFDIFLAWVGKTDAELVGEWRRARDKKRWAKETGKMLLRYFNWLMNEAPSYDVGFNSVNDPAGEHRRVGMSSNYARRRLAVPRSFFNSQCDQVRFKRGAVPRSDVAMGEHEFTQEELRAMFHYGGVKEKAVLSTAVALGWGADDFLNLEWSAVGPFLEADPFTGFRHKRGKTGAACRVHMTPEAIDSLRAWRKVAKSDIRVFPWTNSNLNYIVKVMARRAGVKPRGKISFHLLRKFLLRQLSNAELNRWTVKLLMGKRVSSDVQTYLQDNVDALREGYKKAYPRFSLTGRAALNSRGRIAELEGQVKELIVGLKIRDDIIAEMMPKDRAQEILEAVVKKNKLKTPETMFAAERAIALDPAAISETVAEIMAFAVEAAGGGAE